jgi:hypothetical protein
MGFGTKHVKGQHKQYIILFSENQAKKILQPVDRDYVSQIVTSVRTIIRRWISGCQTLWCRGKFPLSDSRSHIAAKKTTLGVGGCTFMALRAVISS